MEAKKLYKLSSVAGMQRMPRECQTLIRKDHKENTSLRSSKDSPKRKSLMKFHPSEVEHLSKVVLATQHYKRARSGQGEKGGRC